MNTISMLWRKLLTYFLSFMLLSLNFTIDFQTKKINMSSSSVYAQSTTTKTVNGNSKGKTVTVETKEAGNWSSDPGFSLLFMLGTAYIVYKLSVMCKPITLDVWPAIAGVTVYLFSEIAAMMKSEKSLKDSSKEYKTRGEDGKIDDEQYAALQKQRDELNEIASSADKRSKAQNTAFLLFTTSATIALGMELVQSSMDAACIATCPAVGALEVTEVEVEAVQEPSTLKCGQLATLSTTKLTTASACSTATLGVDPAIVTCGAASENALASRVCCIPVVVGKNYYTPKNVNIATLFNFFIPEAEAGGGMGYLMGALAGIGGALAVQNYVVDANITAPWTRAVIWGVIAGIAKVVSNNTKAVADQAREDAKKIDKLMNIMDNSRTGISVISNTAGGIANAGRQISFGPGSGDVMVSGLSCPNGTMTDSTGKVGCKPVSFSTNSAFSGLNFPVATMKSAQAGVDFMNKVAGKETPSSESGGVIEAVTGNANAIMAENKGMKDKINRFLLKNKKKPIDFEKENKKLLSNMVKAAKKGFYKDGNNPTKLLAALGVGAPSSVSDKTTSAKEDVASGVQDEIKAVGGAGATPDNKDFEFNFAPNAEDSLAAHNAELAANADAAAETGEIKDDIIKDKNESLFKVISIRYKKAYDRLLDEL